MTSKPSEDEASVVEVVTPETEAIASFLATEVGAMGTVVSSDATIECKFCFPLTMCTSGTVTVVWIERDEREEIHDATP